MSWLFPTMPLPEPEETPQQKAAWAKVMREPSFPHWAWERQTYIRRNIVSGELERWTDSRSKS